MSFHEQSHSVFDSSKSQIKRSTVKSDAEVSQPFGFPAFSFPSTLSSRITDFSLAGG
jgi:hypothetical protein